VNLWWIILLMAAVTFIPRLLPLLVLRERELHPLLKRFLRAIPYAALRALIFPGVLRAVPDLPVAAIAGMVAAVLVSWFKGGLILSVVASVAVVFLFLLPNL
jgi:branched-subunit amino acid transport protein